MKSLIVFIGIIIFLSITATPSFAHSGCCSHHGGVSGCGCADGTPLSNTCAPYYPECYNGGQQSVQTAPQTQAYTPPTAYSYSLPIPTAKPTQKPQPTSKPKRKVVQHIKKEKNNANTTANPHINTAKEFLSIFIWLALSMKLFRYRRPSMRTMLGITGVNRRIRRATGISTSNDLPNLPVLNKQSNKKQVSTHHQ